MSTNPTSSAARLALIFLAIVVAAFAAAPPVDLPGWAAALLAALATGFAGIGLVPPTWQVNQDRDRAFKKKPKKPYDPGNANKIDTTPLHTGGKLPNVLDGPGPRATSFTGGH